MSQGKVSAIEAQKKPEPARQLEQEPARQPERGPVQQVAPQVAYRRAQMNRNRLRPEDLLALQRTVGNREVRRTVANIMPYRCSNGAMTDIHEYKQSVEADSREHANIVQTQSSGHRTVQQPLDPTNPSAWSLLGRSDFRQLFPEEFEAILGAAPAAGTGAQQTITEAGIPESKEQSAIFEHRLRRLVRMNALGLMASHRATIEGKRDRVLSSLNQPTAPARHAMQAATESEQPNQEEILQAIRAAAKSIAFLNILKKELERYHTTLNILEGSVLINSRTESRIESWLGRMRNSTVPYCSDEIVSYFNERIMTLGSIRNLDLVGAALSIMARNLKDWRRRQIDGVNVALYHLYDKFPFFTQLPTEAVITGNPSFQSNAGLVKGVNTAFADLLEKIDKAIIQIGSEDIHPFDLPEAIKVAKTNLPENLQPFVDRVLRDRQVVQFWKSMGLTLLQTVLVFVPVIGPFAAAGLGAITLGADLESVLDRYALAQASDQTDQGVLGVAKPGNLEWTMLAVQAALTLADLGAGWKAMNEWKPGIRPEAEASATRHEGQLRTLEGSTTSESTPTHAPPGEPHAAGIRLGSPSPLPKEAHYPEGLVEFDLDAPGAQRSYRVSLTDDPNREAGIWMNPQTREYVVVQGGRDFVETEWMNSSDMLRAGRRPNWRLVEHYHPDAQLIDRLPSRDDFQSLMHWQTTGAEARHELTSNVRYTDPQTHIEFSTRFGYSPHHIQPYWVEYRSPKGSLITRRFRDPPWKPGSEYSHFLERFRGGSVSKSSSLPSNKATPPKQTTVPQTAITQPIPSVKELATPSKKQIYKSVKDAPEYPKDFRPVQNGVKKITIKHKSLLDELRQIEPGEWSKVYRDGYRGGKKVSVHYFQSQSGQVFNVKVKEGWSNQI